MLKVTSRDEDRVVGLVVAGAQRERGARLALRRRTSTRPRPASRTPGRSRSRAAPGWCWGCRWRRSRCTRCASSRWPTSQPLRRLERHAHGVVLGHVEAAILREEALVLVELVHVHLRRVRRADRHAGPKRAHVADAHAPAGASCRSRCWSRWPGPARAREELHALRLGSAGRRRAARRRSSGPARTCQAMVGATISCVRSTPRRPMPHRPLADGRARRRPCS